MKWIIGWISIVALLMAFMWLVCRIERSRGKRIEESPYTTNEVEAPPNVRDYSRVGDEIRYTDELGLSGYQPKKQDTTKPNKPPRYP